MTNWYQKYKCRFGDNCVITEESRKLCQKCRLKKCFAVGMKKEWILNEEEKEYRRQRIEENRKYREMHHMMSQKLTKLQIRLISEREPTLTIPKFNTVHELMAYDILKAALHYNSYKKCWTIETIMPILLFNPERPNIINRDMIELQQQLYIYLLQKYLSLNIPIESTSINFCAITCQSCKAFFRRNAYNFE
ncbi:unnamed protein product, partial [Oppiella nova]